ncbi:Cobyrinic acid A,C-diamide synthase [Methyloligella halotolerans]|uniref:Hydrogenobyrinate a,c-diamide synthase n=1 Tax=Methyloligella halotolerans TaxID=1177755 RepID=A0A1E2S1Q0_9HYPH|nr:cobyrinate a,c-diamide synthase [Methyloligella halotolerans]ODA68255.1 Cobyrinic acid A,C-diamide synthase [Methyloligella halotolerans]
MSRQPIGDGPSGIIIAAPRSGSGKTTVSLGLSRAFRNQGLSVQPFKCGPDYIDPAFLTEAAGRPAVNLDSWGMRPELLRHLACTLGAQAELCVAEGVMGLFDGAGAQGQAGSGSTADLAALTGWPVVLVLDVSAQAETAAAVALGCSTYRNDVEIAGVILNSVGSPRHEQMVRAGLDGIGMPVLGALTRRSGLTLPERHLGLVQAGETQHLDETLDALAAMMAECLRLDEIHSLARPLTGSSGTPERAPLRPPGQRIALAQDRAFSFTYPHLVAEWRAAGAEILPFSPLADEAPHDNADAIWLPGGYPELHCESLATAETFKAGMREAASRGAAIHGECGGYMVLGETLEDADGTTHPMLGLLGLKTSFASRKLHLGYRKARLDSEAPALPGRTLFGHEFHYASILAQPDTPLAEIVNSAGDHVEDTGARRGSVTGAFFHLIDKEGAG